MGLIDVITGRRKLRGPAPDRLFAMSTAYVTLQTSLGMTSAGAAAIVFQPLSTADFTAIVSEMEEVVRATASDTGTAVESVDDAYGYRWLILRGGDLEALVAGVGAVSSSLVDGGYGERLLCATFAFRDDHGRPVYWVYNYKRGTFYPFAPVPAGRERRDNERELVLRAQVGAELPVEEELTRWFPLWGIPI